MTKPVISVVTLGCKVNQYDTDAMLNVLAEGGFEVAEGLVNADFYILNTCAVTAEAERKSRQTVGKILKINPDAVIYVCGCASQNNFSQFAKDNVQYISGTEGKVALANRIVEAHGQNVAPFDKIVTDDFKTSDSFEDNDGVYTLKTRHFIKVQDGCNNFCSYCIVPYLRGRSRSRSLQSILRELQSVSGEAKEAVITGINLSAYGKDSGSSLTELILALSDLDMRVRLGSLEVGVIDDEFLKATEKLKSFCPHFHLSLQSGDNTVLKDMNRHYTAEQYKAAVDKIREVYPTAGITTDVIVGYPTENEEEFCNSLAFCEKAEFSDIHVFPYSSRSGTVAGRLPVLPPDVVLDRQKRMIALKRELRQRFMLKNLKIEQEVLIETHEDGMWSGYTPNYIKTYVHEGARNCIVKAVPTVLYKDGVRI